VWNYDRMVIYSVRIFTISDFPHLILSENNFVRLQMGSTMMILSSKTGFPRIFNS
jgi:hypothetical protein